MAAHSSSATRLRSPLPPEAPKESVVSRLLITPLTFISFLISLFLIDSHNHSIRTHTHSTPRPTPTTAWGRIKAFFHGLCYKPVRSDSPYAYVRSPNAGSDSKDGSGRVGVKDGEETWYWHTKQRKMMRAEVSDAFRLRKSVLIVMGCAGFAVGVSGVVVGRWVVVRVRGFIGL